MWISNQILNYKTTDYSKAVQMSSNGVNKKLDSHYVALNMEDEEKTIIDISKKGKELSQKQIEAEDKCMNEMYKKELEASKEKEEAIKNQMKLMEVARRIANGDHVTFGDEKKLMEWNPKLYKAAKTMSIINSDKVHKKYKSLFEDEKEEADKTCEDEISDSVESGNETNEVCEIESKIQVEEKESIE